MQNSQLAHEILFGQLGLDTADLGVLVEGERAELMAALADSGLPLGDRVKLRLWMSRQSPLGTPRSPPKEAPMDVESASMWRSQVDPAGALASKGASQGCGGTQYPTAPGQVYRATRRTQETKQEKGATSADGKGLSAETIAIMVTVLLSFASYGPKGTWNMTHGRPEYWSDIRDMSLDPVPR